MSSGSALPILFTVLAALLCSGCNTILSKTKQPVTFSSLDEPQIGDIRHKGRSDREAKIADKATLRDLQLCDVDSYTEYSATDDGSGHVDAVATMFGRALRINAKGQVSYRLTSGRLEKWTLTPNRIVEQIIAGKVDPKMAAYLTSPEYEFVPVEYAIQDVVVAIKNEGTVDATFQEQGQPVTLGAGETRNIRFSAGRQANYAPSIPVNSPVYKDLAEIARNDPDLQVKLQLWSKHLAEVGNQVTVVASSVHAALATHRGTQPPGWVDAVWSETAALVNNLRAQHPGYTQLQATIHEEAKKYPPPSRGNYPPLHD
jgi:hypothetical protein